MKTIIKTKKAQLRQSRPGFFTIIQSFLLSHWHYFTATMSQLSKTPVSTFMTSAALGIALALPAGLYEMMLSVQKVGNEFDNIHKISLFLKPDVSQEQAQKLQIKLKSSASISAVEYKDQKQALEEFKEFSGFGDAINALNDNPLPQVLIVEPSLMYLEPSNLEQLLVTLKQNPEVKTAQLDVQWLKKLFSLISLAKTGVLVISSLLGLAVLLIIGNTIRLDIENRRQEILVTKLIGGTNSFIRRPFLYLGIWYGLLGGILAIVLVDISFLIIKQPLSTLAELYQSDLLTLNSTEISHNIELLTISILLGLLGALIAVNQQLKKIEPT
ncbi:MAG: ABC transporter permease [Gammaproteobacteria bacterium]|nr:ABC transporter permease [Gammaproteobacteria bacterium]